MKIMVNGKWLSVSRRKFSLFCLFTFAFLFASCSGVPNLEQPECTDARLTVKEFYSNHFGGEMKFSPENLRLLEKFLTPEYFKSLQNLQTDGDVFTTGNNDFPKAFRVGGCKVIEPSKTDFEVLLFWRNETRTEQKAIHAEVVKQGDKWLINKILN